MTNRAADIQHILSTEDSEFAQWVEEHHRCEERLGQLTAKSEIDPQEEFEEKSLKKRKLHLKDQMASRIRSYEEANANA